MRCVLAAWVLAAAGLRPAVT
eukprot:SAG31_NODE_18107_length_646_cov_1.780622_1_plen_20_part_01